MHKLIYSISIPSNSSFAEKNTLAKVANDSNLGIFVSDLPQNHDLFQLLALWKEKFRKIPIMGTAIISPLIYDLEFIKKQIKTLFEMFDKGIELGFGLGDKKLLNKDVTNRLTTFQNSITLLLQDEAIKKSNNSISIAGSGKKLINFASEQNLGLIYNGIINSEIISDIKSKSTRNNISSYIMIDVNDYKSLTPGFISIVSRIVTGLSTKELNRLKIETNQISLIQEGLLKKNIAGYKTWLPEEVIRKVAIFGEKETIFEKLVKFEELQIKQLILSIIGSKQKEELIKYLQKQL